MDKIKLITIGTSAGGVEALQYLLAHLPSHLHVPIVVTMHLPEHSEVQFSKVIMSGHYQVREARDKMDVADDTITFAPPGYHLLIERNHTFSLSQDEPIHFSRPSIDVLFESAAQVYRSEVLGILLTGASGDGARGLLAIHQLGGRTIVQDPATAQAATMPSSALALFNPDLILPLEKIRDDLTRPLQKDVTWKI